MPLVFTIVELNLAYFANVVCCKYISAFGLDKTSGDVIWPNMMQLIIKEWVLALGCMKRLITACFSLGLILPVAASDVCDLYQRCLDPSEAARYQDAIALYQQGDKRSAMITMGEIYHESPSNQLLANNYAVMLAAVGQHAEAALVLEDYLQQDPSVASIAKNLVDSYNNLSLMGTPASEMTAGLSLISPDDSDSLLSTSILEGDATAIDFQALAVDSSDASHVLEHETSESPSSIQRRLEQFLSVWSAGDSSAYLEFFKPNTSPVPDLSYSAWRDLRYARVKPSKRIRVTAENIEEVSLGDGSVETTFTQLYQSSNYQDRVIKTLTWERIDGEWLIVSERQR